VQRAASAVKTSLAVPSYPDLRTLILADGRRINVVRDDAMIGGTKQAAIMSLLFDGHWPESDLAYAGPRQGFAQVALAAACLAAGRQAHVFVCDSTADHPRTAMARQLGAKIHAVPFGRLNVVQAAARRWEAEGEGRRVLPFGLDCPEMIEAIATRAKRAKFIAPTEAWCCAGSGVLARALAKAWPSAQINVVQIGRPPILPPGAMLHVAREAFEDDALVPPPYPSCSNYDAKAWIFVLACAREGALVWNVAA
jgi:hypothetical protein